MAPKMNTNFIYSIYEFNMLHNSPKRKYYYISGQYDKTI